MPLYLSRLIIPSARCYNIPIMFKKQVKCSECGFLGGQTGESSELLPYDRTDLKKFLSSQLYVECYRGQDHVIAGVPKPNEPISQENLIKHSHINRRCSYYFPYNPGHAPEQHLELLKERTQRRFLILASLLSAAVGAAIATIVNIIWS